MTGFWDAAERARSGATAQAGPRPVSRFEGEGDASAETGFEQVVPLADDTPPATQGSGPATAESHQVPEPPPAAEPIVLRETVEIRTESTTASPTAPIARSAPTAEATAIPPPIPATPAAPPASAPPLSVSSTLAPLPAPRDLASAGAVAADPPREIPSERLIHETVTERTTVVVEAAPRLPDLSAPSPWTNGPPAEGLEATASPAPANPPAFNIQIDRIEIRIDPPSPPAAPAATRRPAPPIELNDYLARRGA